MENDRWRKIERVYHAALEQEKSNRAAFIQQACGGDESLEEEVESLLSQTEGDESFLEAPAMEVAAKSLAMSVGATSRVASSTTHSFPAAIGRYRVVRVLGEGGMGIVYEAEQEQPRRSVALKVIKPGFATPERVWRFEHESKALGRLQHPGIAQIYEASTADNGFGQQPYFAMEFIRGQSLLGYAEAHRLNTRQRLALTAKICDAVQHAHERGLVHRDLKPGNILVDETGQPKILDFGVARVTESDAQATRQTDLGQIVGTLAYMSPEQVLADPQAVDTRSDVYSLGVILYELLSGRLPYDVSHRQLHEAIQTIREEDPTSLSSINRDYRGDIETIVGKALEKDKARRYAAAADLAADIQRYLNDEPITARRPSASYQLQKFARRHRALVAGAAAVFVVLVGGIVASSWQAIRANQAGKAALAQRDRAASEARTADAVQKFIEDIFETNSSDQADPVKARQTTARQLLDIGARKIDTELDNAPAAKERMLGILADLYYGLGLSDEAVALDRKRVAVAKASFGANDLRVAAAMSHLGASMHASRAVNEREAVLLEAKAILDRNRDFTSRARGELLLALAEHYQSTDRRKALDYAGEAVGLYRAMPPSAELASALYHQGTIYEVSGDYAKAAAALNEAVAISLKANGNRDPTLPMYAATLAEADAELMQYDAAKQNFELAVRTARALNGEEHVDTIESEARLGGFFSQISQYREALRYLKHARDVCLKTKGADDPFYTPQMLMLYGQTLAASGHLEEGLAAISQAVENRRKNRPGTRYLAQMLSEQASVLTDLAEYKKAQASLDEAAAIGKKVGFEVHEYTSARLKLAFALRKPEEAAAIMERSYGPLSDHDPLSLKLLRNLTARAELALVNDDPADAARLAERASDAIASSSIRPYLRFWEARAALDEGNSYLRQHRASQALPRLQRAVELDSEMFDPLSTEMLPAQGALATAFLQIGDRGSAAKLLAQAESNWRRHRHLGERYEQPIRALRRSFGAGLN
jgi:predicted Ser/Thr protein kinase